MPTYDYECDACNHKFEEFQSFSAELLKTCPKCKKKKLRRLFGAGAAVVFKGTGFYTTDYRSDSYTKAANADKPAETKDSSAKSETKSEAKAETKSESKSDSKPTKKSKDQ